MYNTRLENPYIIIPMCELGYMGHTDNITYNDVITWLKDKYNIFVYVEPFFTYAFKDNMAYLWRVAYVSKTFETEQIIIKSEEKDGYNGSLGGSFNSTIERAFEIAIGIAKK